MSPSSTLRYLTLAVLSAGCLVPLDLNDPAFCAANPELCDDTATRADSDSLGALADSDDGDTALPGSGGGDTDLDTDDPNALPPGVALLEDFSSCPPTPAGWALQGDWQCTLPPGAPGPSSAVTSTHILATAPGGDYAPNRSWSTAWAELPPVDLSGMADPVLRFSAWSHTQADTDGFNLSASNSAGTTWNVLVLAEPAYDTILDGQLAWSGDRSGAWRDYFVDLGSLPRGPVRLRFGFHSDAAQQHPGVHLDDLFIGERGRIPLDIDTQALPAGQVGRPYSHTLTRSGGGSAVTWSLDPSPTAPSWLHIDPSTGTLSGTPDPHHMGSQDIQVRVSDDLFPTNTATALLPLDVRADIGSWDFSSCPDGWVLAGEWQCGAPTTGPATALSGGVLATNLTGNYAHNQAWAASHATSPPLWLPAGNIAVELEAWWDFETCCDGWHLAVIDAAGEVTPLEASIPYDRPDLAGQPAWNAPTGGWVSLSADLSPWQGEEVRLRLAMRSDGSVNRAGVYVDHLRISATSTQFPPIEVRDDPIDAVAEGEAFSFTPRRRGGAAAVTWSVEPSPPPPSWMSFDPATGTLSGTPTTAEVGVHTFTLRVSDVLDPSNTHTRTFHVVVVEQVAAWSFSACPDGWTTAGAWSCGPLTSGPSSLGDPTTGDVLATNPAGNYPNNQAWDASHATSPSFTVPSEGGGLRVRAWWSFETCCDGWHLAVIPDGGSPTVLDAAPAYPSNLANQPAWTVASGGWTTITADLSPWAGQTIQVRAAMRSDVSVVAPGAYIDTVTVSGPVFRIETQSIPHAVADQPYQATLAFGGAGSVTWSLEPSPAPPAWLSLDPTTGALSGTPALTDLGELDITVRATDTADPTRSLTRTLRLDVRDILAEWRFSACPDGWTFTGPWACGAPTSGPGAALTGQVIATNLSANYPNSVGWASNDATSPAVSLTGNHTTLTVTAWWSFEGTSTLFDGWQVAVVDASGTATALATSLPYNALNLAGEPAWSGPDNGRGWQTFTADLSPWAGQDVSIRFRMYSDGSVNLPGAYIDEVRIE